MRKVEVFIEGKRLDLFEEESINLNRSVQDIKDISKIYTDFTQTFTVPASKNNQKIFRHFEIPEIDNGFDTRIKKNGSITLNSLDFVTGKIRLEKVQLKGNRPSSFSITFFGDLVSLQDLVGEDKLSDLDWLSQFNHPYTSTSVMLGVLGELNHIVDGISHKVIKYPLISPIRRYYYSSDVSDTTNTSEIANIAFNDLNQLHGVKWNELKPSIGFEWIIRAIQEKYGITFSGDFFKRNEFKTLQLWLANDKGLMKAGGKSIIPVPDDDTYITDHLFTGTVYGQSTFTPDPPDYFEFKLTITPVTEDPYTIVIEDSGEPFRQLTNVTGEQIVRGAIKENEPDAMRNFAIGYFISSDFSMQYDMELEVNEFRWEDMGDQQSQGYGQGQRIYNLTNQLLNTDVKILQQMPELTVFDFLTGLFKMFNLTIVPENGSLAINNLEEWYAKGNIIDVTPYIDNTELPIEKGTILGQIDLKFQEPKTFLQEEFITNYGRAYGDLNLILRDSEGRKLDGDKLEVKLPFEQMIYERLTDQNDSELTNVQYGWVVDESQESVKIKPHVFYIQKQRTPGKDIGILNEIGTITSFSAYQKPSHIGALELARFSTTFSADYEEYSGDAITSNLLTNYYLDYLTDLFSIKRRVFNYKAKFPSNIVRNLKLNDRLVIKGRRYIINTMDLQLTSGDAALELINDIYRGETQEGLTTKIILSSYFAEFLPEVSTGSFTYQTNEQVNHVTLIELMDLGSGTEWITYTQTGNLIEYNITENLTGLDRYTAIKITGFSGSITHYKIKQNG